MRVPRTHPRPPPEPASCFVTVWRFPADACSAGIRPNTSAVMEVRASANQKTVRSGVASIRSGSAPGIDAISHGISACSDHEKSSEPHTAPASAMIALSVSNC